MSTWISIPSAAAIFGVNRSTVWRWVRENKLQPVGYVDGRPVFERGYIEREASKRAARQATAVA